MQIPDLKGPHKQMPYLTLRHTRTEPSQADCQLHGLLLNDPEEHLDLLCLGPQTGLSQHHYGAAKVVTVKSNYS